MTKNINLFIQGVASISQLVNQFGGLIPHEYVPYVTGGLTALQAVVGIVAHHYNTDGTPQVVAFIPPIKKG